MGGGRWRASWLHVAHAAPALLLVLDREPDLPAGRAGHLHRIELLLRCQLPSAETHLLRVHPRRPRHGWHRDPLRIQLPVMREGDIRVRQQDMVLPVPPRLLHRNADTLGRPAGRRRREIAGG
ncbi:hypothetical protein D1007_60358 [Hordeum vulgare]|nr:hypothetical protein D1007_60358 [Hordeum vulgare]